MKNTVLRFIAVLFVFSLFNGRGVAQTAEELFQKGVQLEEVKGDLEKAINVFKQVVEKNAQNKPLASKALLRLGRCYEKLGKGEARKAYERIIKQFPDQSAPVAEARVRLAALDQQKELSDQTVKLSVGDRDLTCLSLSPDGSKMAGMDMTIGQNIAVYDFNSKEQKLVTRFRWAENPDDGWTAGAVWSPDGKEVAYFKGSFGSGPGELWASTLDGKSRLLYRRDRSKIGPCDWIDDGSGIVIMVKDSTGYTLGIVPASGGSFKALKSFEHGSLNVEVLYSVASASPDGRFVVFEEGSKGARDILIVSTDGKKVTTLTDGPADDAQPMWSPDGGHVIFRSNRHGSWALWGVAVKEGIPDGAPFMITSGFDDTELLNWSHAGLAYVRTILLVDIFRMPVNPSSGKPSGMAQQIQYTPTGSNVHPVWSPDGKHFAFVSNRGGLSGPGYLVVMPVDGGKPREFKIPMTYTYWTYFFSDLRWTPDGKGLGFSGKDGSEKLSLYHLTLETGKWETPPLEGVKGWTRIEWAGDGKSYFYSLIGEGIVKRAINSAGEQYVYRASTSKDVFGNLRISRDHKWLAFNNGENMVGDNSQIVTVEVATGNSSVMTPKGYRFLTWSPESRRMVVLRRVDKTAEYYTIGIDGSNPEKIDFGGSLPKGVKMGTLDWSPTGKEIVFSSDRRWIFENHLMRTVIPKERR